MRSYRLLEPGRCAEIVAAIDGLDWQKGHSVRELGTVKRVRELRGRHDETARELLTEIGQAIADSAILQREMLDVRDIGVGIFDPRFQRYDVGDEYRIHTDSAFMGRTRTDLALTLFLNDDYEGGVLHVDGGLPNDKPLAAKASAGHAIVYPCQSPHWVTPVTAGRRIVAITWLQCRVPSAADRELLTRLHRVIDDIERPGTADGDGVRHMTAQEKFANLGAVHQALVKRFSTE